MGYCVSFVRIIIVVKREKPNECINYKAMATIQPSPAQPFYQTLRWCMLSHERDQRLPSPPDKMIRTCNVTKHPPNSKEMMEKNIRWSKNASQKAKFSNTLILQPAFVYKILGSSNGKVSHTFQSTETMFVVRTPTTSLLICPSCPLCPNGLCHKMFIKLYAYRSNSVEYFTHFVDGILNFRKFPIPTFKLLCWKIW